jgi:serine/threonine protein kinase
MTPPSTNQDLVELIRKSGVVPAERLDAFFRRQRGRAKQWREPQQLATALLEDGLLSRFQSRNLLKGRSRGYWIKRCLVLEPLGAGGMGRVFLCEQTPMRRLVAVKVLPPNTPPGSTERFLREARASAALDHPNLVRAFDADHEDRFHFMVLEFVDGPTLQKYVDRQGPLDIPRACHYTAQAALGLSHAHAAGWIHRDVKPGNLLVDHSGTVKVLDLDLARFSLGADEQLTKQFDDQNLLGTADYIAPEQTLPDHVVDSRADIYSLGVTLYFLLTGQPPFAAGNVLQKLTSHRLSEPTPLTQLRPDLPNGLALLVERMMAKTPAQRFQTAAEVAVALQPYLAGGPFRPNPRDLPSYCPRVRLLAETGKATSLSLPSLTSVDTAMLMGTSAPVLSSGAYAPATAFAATTPSMPAPASVAPSAATLHAVAPLGPSTASAAPNAPGMPLPASSRWRHHRVVLIALTSGAALLLVALAGITGLWAWEAFGMRAPISGPVVGPGPSSSPNSGDYLSALDAGRKLDQRCTVQYVVKRAALSTNRKTLFLNSDANCKAETNFTVVIHGVDAEANIDVAALPTKYQGKTIRATGLVTLFDGRPQIIAPDTASIKIVTDAR